MSNTNFLTYNPNTSTNEDLVNIFQNGNSGIVTGFKLNNGTDIGSIFAALNGGTQINFNTNYKISTGADLKTVFLAKSSSQYTITNANAYIKNTFIANSIFNAIIFDYTGLPSTWNGGSLPNPTPGQCDITFNSSVNLRYLIIGGGGGAGQGSNDPNFSADSGGVGGGGAGIIYYNGASPFSIPANTTFNIQVGFNGGGNNNPNPVAGDSIGGISGASYITSTFQDISFNSFGGSAGGGCGVTFDLNTGDGGKSFYSTSLPGPYNNFGAGGGGGGGAYAYNYGPSNAGYGGFFNTTLNQGQTGSNGNYPYPTFGSPGNGDGGSNYFTANYSENYLLVPFTDVSSVVFTSSYVYCGNGGGGGGYYYGGTAGSIYGGSGGGNSTKRGQDAVNGFSGGNFYYGNGGGGSAFDSNQFGGNGSRGVVMLWWEI